MLERMMWKKGWRASYRSLVRAHIWAEWLLSGKMDDWVFLPKIWLCDVFIDHIETFPVLA